MYTEEKIWVAKNKQKQFLLPKMANRHGLIAGATGTGKTITLKVMAEAFSAMGVPVFMADVKGDLSGMCIPGQDNEGMQNRIAKFGLAESGFAYSAYPTVFWDVYGDNGCPVRTTVSEMGPLLLARVMDLNDTQTGVLEVIFKVADDDHLLLLDLKDLKAILNYVANHASTLKGEYGNIASSSVGAIMRGLLQLESQGGDKFFGEPALNMADWMRTDTSGKGVINILNAVQLYQNPLLYSTFLLWMLSELYEMLPEAGDLEKPKMIFYFDEAHLLFDGATKVLLQKIEQIVRLIRSKGVGVYFISQKPTDMPDDVLAQLGNRIQHGLHAYSPAEQKAVKAAAESFCENPAFDTIEAIMGLGTGEAVLSFLDEDGRPSLAERTYILPPQSFMGAAPEETWKGIWRSSEMNEKYADMVDRESAFEILNAKTEKAHRETIEQEEKAAEESERLLEEKAATKEAAREEKEKARKAQHMESALESGFARIAKSALPHISASRNRSMGDRIKNTALNVVGGEVTKGLVRGLFGILKK